MATNSQNGKGQMAELALGRSDTIGLGFGHTATMVRTEADTSVVIHGPPGTPSLEIRVTKSGAVVQTKTAPVSLTETPAPADSRFSVRQYASFRAECISAPEKAGEVRERYGLSEADEAAETEAWRRKFAEDASLFELYKRLFQQFRATPDRGTCPPPASTMSPLMSTLSALSRGPRSAAPSSGAPTVMPSSSSLSLSMSGAQSGLHPVVSPSEAGAGRMLSLGHHATLAAELLSAGDHELVYQKYGLADREVRREVLARCEARLEDPTVQDTWKRLYALAVGKLRAAR
jgi:hypothetical protein